MKVLKIFYRDFKVTIRQFITILIIICPIILSFVISLATPGITDSPIRLAMLRGENPEQVEYLSQFANVELFDTVSQIESRVMEQDDVPAVLPDEQGGYYILTQGNENDGIVTAAKLYLTYAENNVQADTTRSAFYDFGRTAAPLKITLIASMIVLVTILSGMLICNNIVDEKIDMTIRSIRVAPVSITSFIPGKSLIGIFNTIICSVLCVLVAGFSGIDYGQLLLICLCSSFVGLLIGFITGLTSDDFIAAMGNLKLIMIPAMAPILAIELLSDKWQWLFYWSPFYWAYDGIKSVLSQTAAWSIVLRDTGIVIGITLVVYLILYPRMTKKLI